MTQLEMYLSAYIIITGFVCSGVISSCYQWIKAQPAGFSVEYDSWIGGIGGVLFCVFAGPFIIMRNTIRGRKIEGRPIGWVIAASAIASLWSFCTGLMILHTVLSLRTSVMGML